ncbi:hypothetical protein I7I48_03278 [Histoplasma ohiense]|nr:hypothetical protein I7I48_03278 [Histoplasma ohiense (nom. inval.)]
MRQQEHHMRQEKAAEKTARSLWVLTMACFNAGERFNCSINALNKLNMVFDILTTTHEHRGTFEFSTFPTVCKQRCWN